MFLKNLSNSQLVDRFHKLVRTERKITHLVLECIAEIDQRKIYLQNAHPSLYEYLIKDFGYSPSAALRRIEAARLLREVPEVAQKVEDGSLNLSQLSKVQQALRTVFKTENKKLDANEKRRLLEKIENTTQEKTELILAQELNFSYQPMDKTKIHHDESVTLTITLNKEQMEKLKLVSDLVSHSVSEKSWAQVVTYLAEKELDRRTKNKTKTSQETSLPALNSPTSPPNWQKSTPLNQRQPLPAGLRKMLLNPKASCAFKIPHTGKICGSQRFLQIDHIHPVWAGGTNRPTNLQVLCAQHNQWKYQLERLHHRYGGDEMDPSRTD